MSHAPAGSPDVPNPQMEGQEEWAAREVGVASIILSTRAPEPAQNLKVWIWPNSEPPLGALENTKMKEPFLLCSPLLQGSKISPPSRSPSICLKLCPSGQKRCQAIRKTSEGEGDCPHNTAQAIVPHLRLSVWLREKILPV